MTFIAQKFHKKTKSPLQANEQYESATGARQKLNEAYTRLGCMAQGIKHTMN